MEFFSNAMRNIMSSESDHSNILETNHHLKPVFEKIDTTRYFRFLVCIEFISEAVEFRVIARIDLQKNDMPNIGIFMSRWGESNQNRL